MTNQVARESGTWRRRRGQRLHNYRNKSTRSGVVHCAEMSRMQEKVGKKKECSDRRELQETQEEEDMEHHTGGQSSQLTRH